MTDIDLTPAPMVDIETIAEQMGTSPAVARAYLDHRYDYPVATYKGRPLWLAETMHDAVEAAP